MPTDIALNWFLAISFTLFGVVSAIAVVYIGFTTTRGNLGARAVAVMYYIIMAVLLVTMWAADSFRLF